MTADRGPKAPEGGSGPPESAWDRAEQVARASYGRLLAILAAPGGDIPLAEDCLAEAFAQALRTWPESGVPDNPEGWLLTVARNRRRDVLKSAARRTSVPLEDAPDHALTVLDELDPDAIPDERLALLFVCGHPAIDSRVRTPLMLQTVLGFEAREIAEAFVVPTTTMAQRLVRAKRRIREARIRFAVPGRSRMPERLPTVLEAIYGAYAIDWWPVAGPARRESLADEALYLAVTLAELLEDEPEAFGLAALIALSRARSGARRSSSEYVPLEEQDPALWDRRLIALGERCLRRAYASGEVGRPGPTSQPGRFQIEAAIQSAHCARAASGITDWNAIRTFYDALVAIAPTLGARVARAAAIGRMEGPGAGLAALEKIEDGAMQRFQPAWATRAHLLAVAGRGKEAARAYRKAISLTTDPGVRAYLERRAARFPAAPRS